MSLLGPRRRTAVCLLLAGLTGLCGCDVLTDAPLTDSEMSAFLAEADSYAARSRGRAFQATAVAAADQRSAITGALSLSRIRSDAAAEAATLATRVGAVASDLSQAESAGLEVARSALDQAMQGEDVEAITTALSNLRHAVAAAESAVSARRSSTEPDQVAAPGEESPTGAPSGRGDGESAEADRPGEGEPESPAQVGAPSDAEPSGPQDFAEPAQGPPS
ncbi:hypothetical protein [Actinomyces oris]|uniref:hypothetical protein n=1 Tax=Actinomyces oris TaxID=544580 RepID=UPI0028F042DC|nr:hypothetical protein [Actinomyces oris]